ncbi:hypothetical protein [Sinorhizobium sp. 22678]|uniref:hypothetical protein n=1 Tax=Sinorhizobium sp. 22678 TaxID=3453955 RepID=UPI003F82D9B6
MLLRLGLHRLLGYCCNEEILGERVVDSNLLNLITSTDLGRKWQPTHVNSSRAAREQSRIDVIASLLPKGGGNR